MRYISINSFWFVNSYILLLYQRIGIGFELMLVKSGFNKISLVITMVLSF